MFAGIGRFVVRHPVWVILAWVVIAAAVIGFAPKLMSTSDEASFLPTHYESIQAMQLQQTAFPQAATPAAIIVVERRDGAPLTAADSATVTAVADRLTADHVPDVTAHPGGAAVVEQAGAAHRGPDGAADQPQRPVPGERGEGAARHSLQPQLTSTDLKAGITGYGRAGPGLAGLRQPGRRDHRRSPRSG